MPFDTNSLPLSGGIVIAALLYAGVSVLITGQVVGERTINKSNWELQCHAALKSEMIAREPAPTFIPKLDCNSILGLFGAEGKRVCRRHGNPQFNFPMLDQLNAQKRRVQALQQKRLSFAASKIGSRCGCAMSVTLEKNRIPWAIYAGSIRTITPPAIKNVQFELETALRSPLCAMKG
ncbi:MAG: hypothetical protein COA52_20240 [Hyphomicrobiales bacterium]|nr:MAG: hypothetical protein COA52_20240 [Hyphomicrobiales bacterium]